MKHLICIFFLHWITFHLSAQNYETRFQLSSINCETQEVCYNVQLRPNGPLNFNLAGQNYRIFYNSSLAGYISGQSLLPSSYQGFTLIQDIQDQNADEINGSLSFEATLGFLNFAMDLNDIQNGGIVLSPNEWTSTATLCFRAEGDVLNNIDSCLELVWGRDGLTNSYATAFVEVSRWVAANNTTNSNGILYDDLNAADGASSCLVISCQPTAIFVADITINETVDSAQLQVCIPVPTTEDVTVNLTTADSTAIASSDYAAQTNTLITITTGQTCSSVSPT